MCGGFWENNVKYFPLMKVFLFLCSNALAAVYPGPNWKDDYDPIASPDAIIGGKFKMVLGPYPSSFNLYTNYTSQSLAVFSLLYDGLFDVHPLTLDWSPRLASSIEVSDDQLTFTIHLDSNAVWSDGEPITSQDFLFTWETILDPKSLAGVHKHSLEKFGIPDLIDEKTIRLKADKVDWSNMVSLASFVILPKHHFEGLDFNDQDPGLKASLAEIARRWGPHTPISTAPLDQEHISISRCPRLLR